MARTAPKSRAPRKSSSRPNRGYALLPGEEFGFDEPGSRKSVSDEELNSRYTKGEVRIVTESARYSLAGILAMLQEEVPVEDDLNGATERRYKLDPEYQRRHRWNNQRKSRLIESFLMNIPVPPVFLYERDLARFEVMDGRQRLTALADFYDNQFELEGLEYWRDLEGRTYNKLPSKVRDGIDRRYISSIILLKETASNDETAADLKKIVFERLNSGGVKLSPQETRNAVFPGELNQLCLRLSHNAEFRKMWGIPPDVEDSSSDDDYADDPEDETLPNTPTASGKRMFEKMEDVELILRFFAYRHIQQSTSGLNRISDFLDKFLLKANKYAPPVLRAYEVQFNETVSFLFDCLDVDAFSIITESGKPRPTKFVYDAIMYVANAPDVREVRGKLLANKNVVREELMKMYSADRLDDQPSFAGRRTNNADIHSRNRKMRAAFDAILFRV